MAEFTVEGEEMIEKEATAAGNSAHVYVPKKVARLHTQNHSR